MKAIENQNCLKQAHKNKKLLYLCLEDICHGKRLNCQICLSEDHKNHSTILLDQNNRDTKLNNLKRNCRYKQAASTKEEIIEKFQRLINIKDDLLKTIDKFKQTFEDQIENTMNALLKSFDEDASKQALQIIFSQNSKEKDIEKIVKSIKGLQLKHVKQIPKLLEITECVIQQLSSQFDQKSIIIADNINYLNSQMKQWSLFKRTQWNEPIKVMKSRQLKQQTQENLIIMAQQNQWWQILDYVQSGKKLSQIDHLDFHGYNIQVIPDLSPLCSLNTLYLHGNSIERIQNLQSLTNLTLLNLLNNHIKKIQNLDNLVNLTQLWLDGNKIKKIQNLHKLVNLTYLRLNQNQIEKIENLDTLTKLEELYLYGNKIKKVQNLQKLVKIKKIVFCNFIGTNPLQISKQQKIELQKWKKSGIVLLI